MKGIVWLVIIIILLTATLIGINKYYKPNNQEEQFNVSISAEFNRKLIKTGMNVDGTIINTSTSYELIKTRGGLIKIKNMNLENQIFYETEIEVNISGDTRIDIVLDKPELPEIKVKDNGTILLILSSENFQEVDFCIKGSYNYIFIKAEGYAEIKKIKGFENYDICYNGDFSLDGNKQEIEISYTEFSNPIESDFMNVSFIDKANNIITKTIK